MVLKKDGEDQFDRSCEKVLYRVKEDRNILQTIERRKVTTCVGTVFENVTERKIWEKIRVTGRRGRRSTQLLYDLNTLRTGDADLRFLRYNCAGRVTQICVFNTVKLGTSASSP